MTRIFLLTAALALSAVTLSAQVPAADPSARLREVLPASVADQVLATIAEARAVQLPAAALEHRALELAAKNVAAEAIAGDIAEQSRAMAAGRAALQRGGDAHPEDDEVEAAGAAMGRGVDGAQVSALAQSAPSGRSLAVPLFVIAGLIDRGLPADEAMARVQAQLQARASDEAIGGPPAGRGRPELTGPALAGTKQPTTPDHPASVPTNPGPGNRPDVPTPPAGRP